ncbi:hypothetical protein PUN28_012976 [Cardiocondyla obscurior]|uniref:Uncharacterized protein n=1 Tax=Cardiocondyla obscurior TaxID=286306 RepID=A0AAW2FBA8_9HYME
MHTHTSSLSHTHAHTNTHSVHSPSAQDLACIGIEDILRILSLVLPLHYELLDAFIPLNMPILNEVSTSIRSSFLYARQLLMKLCNKPSCHKIIFNTRFHISFTKDNYLCFIADECCLQIRSSIKHSLPEIYYALRK